MSVEVDGRAARGGGPCPLMYEKPRVGICRPAGCRYYTPRHLTLLAHESTTITVNPDLLAYIDPLTR
jgi:hypothetical protein